VDVAALVIVAALHAGDTDLARLSNVEIKDRGEAAFAQGVQHRDDSDSSRRDFRTAAACFEELRRRGASNALLYRNLANSHLLAGDIAHAILAYRRGLQIAPGDAELMHGLQAARKCVSYPAGSNLGRPGSEGQASWLSRVGGAWLIGGAAILYFGACIGFTRWLMKRRTAFLMFGLVALLAAGILTVVAVREATAVSLGPLVVISQDDVLLRAGDSLKYPARYDSTRVNRGVEGYLIGRRGNWLQVELSGGEVGWIMQEFALVDEEEDAAR
jgi:hypothetical protein